ncbi:PH domain-containing protein [Methanobrevibacter sp.]|uniref:PH domain-containing protein n=1 Tax=Methanobrevibacter sp. TaxID=66852 RepID=UPI00388D33E0
MARFCKNCGTELEEGSIFCNECGTKFGENAPSSNNASNDLFRTYNIDMMDGEFVIRHSQIHSGCLILPTIVFGIGFLIGLFIVINLIGTWFLTPGTVFFSFFNTITIIGLIWFIIRYIGYKTNDLILTNKRVFGKCGLISTTQMQSPLNKIDSVSFSNGLFGKLIGYGTIKIATTSSNFKFRFVREGETFYNDIFNQVEAAEVENRDKNAKAIVDAMAEKLS